MPSYNVHYIEKKDEKPKFVKVFSPSVEEAERYAKNQLPKRAKIIGVSREGEPLNKGSFVAVGRHVF